MATDFKLPELGENVTGGTVVDVKVQAGDTVAANQGLLEVEAGKSTVNVLVKEGDQIEANQGVVELETDKAVIEVPAPHAGKVTKVHVQKKQTVKVGQPLISIETAEKVKPESGKPKAEDTEKKPAKAD